MSQTSIPDDDRSEDPIETVRKNRESYEYLANTDLPIAPYCQNALDRLQEADRNE